MAIAEYKAKLKEFSTFVTTLDIDGVRKTMYLKRGLGYTIKINVMAYHFHSFGRYSGVL